MGPTSDGQRLDERGSRTQFQQPKARLGLFSIRGIDSNPTKVIRLAAEPEPTGPFGSLRHAFYYGQIALFHLAAFKQLAVRADRALAFR